MSSAIGYKCMSCGFEKEMTDKITYICEKCNSNLEIVYDYSKIKEHATKKFFEENKNYNMFRYSHFYPLEENTTRSPLQVGWTPLYRTESLGKKYGCPNLYIKDEGKNPSGSLKDRAGSIALAKSFEFKAEKIAGASTGNAGSSMACLCASVGISPIIFVPKTAPKAKIAQLLLYGAKVIAVNGTYDMAFDLCHDVCEKYGWFNRNTGYNPFTREGKKSCSFEICEQLGWKAPDWVVVSVGDGNIISGIWKGFKDLYNVGLIDKLPKICAAQSEKSNAVVKSVKNSTLENIKIETISATTLADSISVDLPRDGIGAVKAVLESNGTCVEFSDEKILEALKEVSSMTGIFTEPAGSASIAGFKELAKQGIFKDNETVVCVATGNGLKDVDSAMKVAGTPHITEPSVEEAIKVIKES